MSKPQSGEIKSPDEAAPSAAELSSDGDGLAPFDREATVAANMAKAINENTDAVCRQLTEIIDEIREQADHLNQLDARNKMVILPGLNKTGEKIVKTASELAAGVRQAALAGLDSADDQVFTAAFDIGQPSVGGERTQQALLEAFANPSPAVRIAAIKACRGLSKYDGKELFEGFIALFDDSDATVRLAIVNTQQHFNDRSPEGKLGRTDYYGLRKIASRRSAWSAW